MTEQGPPDQSSPGHGKRRCSALSSRGPCRMTPLTGSQWCWNHSPEHAVARAEGRKLGGHRRKRRSPSDLPGTVSLRTVDEVLQLLERTAVDALVLDLSPERCRVLTAIATAALSALEKGSFEDRLAALEQAAGVRRSA